MAAQPAFTWTVGGGAISSSGLFTAPSTAGNYRVTAKCGSIAGGAKVTVTAPPPVTIALTSPDSDWTARPVLAALVQKLDADGSLNRADMIQILTSVGTGGTVSATDLADLKTILANAAAIQHAQLCRRSWPATWSTAIRPTPLPGRRPGQPGRRQFRHAARRADRQVVPTAPTFPR